MRHHDPRPPLIISSLHDPLPQFSISSPAVPKCLGFVEPLGHIELEVMALEIFSNSTHSDELTWVPNPTTRGTANILVTCLLTLLLCIWKAVHLNLPEYGRPTFCYLEYQTWRKIGWLFTSLIAPELVVYVAWSQLLQARTLANYYNQVSC